MKTKAFTLICEYSDEIDDNKDENIASILDSLFAIGKEALRLSTNNVTHLRKIKSINIEPITEVE